MMEAYGLDQLITFSKESHTKNVFFESDRLKAQVMGLKVGQEIPALTRSGILNNIMTAPISGLNCP
jgi:hypothetical protein